jgi:general secretion pathway protein A
MYLKAFGLKTAPFAMTASPAMLYLSASHRESLAGLCYSLLDKKGLVLLVGPAGTGKTTLVARAIERLPASLVQFATILSPTLAASEFIEAVLLAFGITNPPASKPQRLHLLQKLLLQAQASGKISVLVVDEAQKLTRDLLEEVRLLGNLENRDEKLLQLVLAGQSELAATLNRDHLAQLKQRIAVRLSLNPLTKEELVEYIEYRWQRAGAVTEPPFTPGAMELAARFSGGIPRLVNAICDNALLHVFGERITLVEPRHILAACRDLDIAPFGIEGPSPQRMNAAAAVPNPQGVGYTLEARRRQSRAR